VAINVVTVKPDGTGDYTTLQSAFDGEKAGASVLQMECYAGGDLGGLVASGGDISFAPSEAEPFRIYVAADEGHTGKDDGSGAYAADDINISGISHVHIEGLRLSISPASAGTHGFVITGVTAEVKLKKCIVICKDISKAVGLVLVQSADASVIVDGEIHNNIIFYDGSYPAGAIQGMAIQASTGNFSPVFNVDVYNNTVVNCPIGVILAESRLVKGSGTPTLNADVKNNLVATSRSACFQVDWLGNGTITASHNLDSDNTANTVLGDLYSQANKVQDAQVVDPYRNWQLKILADAINTGTTVASVPTDFAGTSRPIGAAYDIGAHEREGLSTRVASGVRVFGGVRVL
jgi:hypothetical protein